jgi:hypothetical protein
MAKIKILIVINYFIIDFICIFSGLCLIYTNLKKTEMNKLLILQFLI